LSDHATSERDVGVDTAHHGSPVERSRGADECSKPSQVDRDRSAVHMDVEQDVDQLLFHDPPLMFAFLATAFRELDEIMNRVRRTVLSASHYPGVS